MSKEKIIAPDQIKATVAQLRRQKKTIATLNGCFDLLHAGHLYIIEEASRQADILFVALNSDISVKGYKGPERPLIAQKWRLQMVAALEYVDFVTWFDELDPRQLLETIVPDVHVNGAEYGSNCLEAEVVKKVGARLHLVERIAGLATSDIVKKIKET